MFYIKFLNFRNDIIKSCLDSVPYFPLNGIVSIAITEKLPISAIPSLTSECHPPFKFIFLRLIEYLYIGFPFLS